MIHSIVVQWVVRMKNRHIFKKMSIKIGKSCRIKTNELFLYDPFVVKKHFVKYGLDFLFYIYYNFHRTCRKMYKNERII